MIPLILLGCILASALFAGLETGFVSLNRVGLRVQARRGDRRAATLLRLLQRPERLLTTFLIGNTLCNVGGGSLASFWLVDTMKNETAGSLVATVGMSALLLVFGELVPKSYFRWSADQAVPKLLWFIHLVRFLFRPLEWFAGVMLRVVGGREAGAALVTREELRQLVREGLTHLRDRERRMLQQVFAFGETTAREVMIPLPDVVSIAESAPIEALLDRVRKHRYTRLPVYQKRVDSIVGLVSVFDVLYDPDQKPLVEPYVRPIHVVPETSFIHRVLVDLQRRRESMALVVNEFGACTGIVTVEDIVEELTGELVDEHEEVRPALKKTPDGYHLDASLDIDDLNQELGLSLQKDRFETVGGLLLSELGRIPEPGERVQVGNAVFEILSVHRYGIRSVALRILQGGQGEP